MQGWPAPSPKIAISRAGDNSEVRVSLHGSLTTAALGREEEHIGEEDLVQSVCMYASSSTVCVFVVCMYVCMYVCIRPAMQSQPSSHESSARAASPRSVGERRPSLFSPGAASRRHRNDGNVSRCISETPACFLRARRASESGYPWDTRRRARSGLDESATAQADAHEAVRADAHGANGLVGVGPDSVQR